MADPVSYCATVTELADGAVAIGTTRTPGVTVALTAGEWAEFRRGIVREHIRTLRSKVEAEEHRVHRATASDLLGTPTVTPESRLLSAVEAHQQHDAAVQEAVLLLRMPRTPAHEERRAAAETLLSTWEAIGGDDPEPGDCPTCGAIQPTAEVVDLPVVLAEVPRSAVLAAVERVHAPMRITDDDDFLYAICSTCCTGGSDEQTEDCATYHEKPTCWPCQTVRVVREAVAVSSPEVLALPPEPEVGRTVVTVTRQRGWTRKWAAGWQPHGALCLITWGEVLDAAEPYGGVRLLPADPTDGEA